MTTAGSRSSIAQKYLDPATSLGEVMFGLIMTLTFTLAAGVIIEDEGREGARELLIAIIGCNIAWGIIDGALYLMGELFGRGRLRNVGRIVREESDDRAAEALVAGEVDELLEPVTTDAERSDLYRRIVRNIRSTPGRTTGLTKADADGCAWRAFGWSSSPACRRQYHLWSWMMRGWHCACRTQSWCCSCSSSATAGRAIRLGSRGWLDCAS